MDSDDEFKEVIHDVERIKHELDERIKDLKKGEVTQRHLPADESLAQVFPVGPTKPGERAPRLGS